MHEKLKAVIGEGFVCRSCSRNDSKEEVPSIQVTENNMYHLVELDMPQLNSKLETESMDTSDLKDKNILWKIKSSRISLQLR
jgi:hypothetical protein